MACGRWRAAAGYDPLCGTGWESSVGGVRFRRATTSVPLPGLFHSMSISSLAAVLPVDGRQSSTALAVARGTTRLLHSLGFSMVSELPLASGRRADLVALGTDGELWIVEIKSSIADLRADQKWLDYRLHWTGCFLPARSTCRARFFRRMPGSSSPTPSARRWCGRRRNTGSMPPRARA